MPAECCEEISGEEVGAEQGFHNESTIWTKGKLGPLKCRLRKSAARGCLQALLDRLRWDRIILGTISIITGSVTLIVLVSSFFISFEENDLMCLEEEHWVEMPEEDFCPPENSFR